jgi:tRNA threonylcarbamoyl adenosine modification protein YjeE
VTAAPGPLYSDSPAATERFGAAVGAVLRAGDVLVLSGPLGAGKTCMVRGMVAGAGGNPAAVRSPTFVLHQPHRGAALTVHHIDLYRLGAGADVEVLDLVTALCDGAAVIEWGEYADLREFAPATISIDAEPQAPPNRRVLRLADPAPAHLAGAWRALAVRASR